MCLAARISLPSRFLAADKIARGGASDRQATHGIAGSLCGLIPSGWQLVVAAGPPSGALSLNHRAAGGGFLCSVLVPGRRVRGLCVRAGWGGLSVSVSQVR